MASSLTMAGVLFLIPLTAEAGSPSGSDTTPPRVIAAFPIDDASSVARSAAPRVEFDEAVVPNTATMTVTDAAGNTVAGSAALDPAGTTLTFTPSGTLANTTIYTVTVTAAADATGNAMTTPHVTTFTTVKPVPPPGVCPCGLWDDATVPQHVEAEAVPGGLELGIRFRVDEPGSITGLRFHKGPRNTGSHVGTLWTDTGDELARATFTDESSTGWQEVRFATPVQVVPETTYVASYHTDVGYHSINYASMWAGRQRPPLHAPAYHWEGGDRRNGVYKYGGRGFPTLSVNNHYSVDVIYQYAPDVRAPRISSASPAIPDTGSGETSVPVSAKVRVDFDEAVSGPLVAVTGPAGQVAGNAVLDGTGKNLVFTPSAPLAAATEYTIEVSAAQDAAGNVMTAKTWSFTTAGVGACPCTLFSSGALPATPATADSAAVNLGVKFTVATPGYVSGVRFYKSAQNTGTHTGGLWKADGTPLSKGVFQNETAGGWQTLTFGTPVPVAPGTTYIASYHAPNGRYASNGSYFTGPAANAPLATPASAGVYAYGPWGAPVYSYGGGNYWVDPIFVTTVPADTSPPDLLVTDALDGESSVPLDAPITATFTEDVDPASIAFTVTGPYSGHPDTPHQSQAASVSGTVGYDAASRKAVFTPSAALAYQKYYEVELSGAKDAAGNAMQPVRWAFETVGNRLGGIATIWPDNVRPAVRTAADHSGVVLGVKFRVTVSGYASAIRFHKGPGNHGPHVTTLWKADGTKLAEVEINNETTAGWQYAHLPRAVRLNVGTTYVVSYHAPFGKYSYTPNVFASSGVSSPPLYALRSGEEGPNSVYAYGANQFPTRGSTASYYVDVAWVEQPPRGQWPPIE
ncbi:DUF4082 domain-containing protein [Rhizohabitans arisaemae]|uniref:DUF4082 domain-containing protein n=1 Tax=Rhizohabitans arisaemae TaxID=2720610 RepID=UPI0024B0DE81|nr:DUF4082 domain-containing protein [Rhizohabitans arisaemae]